MNQNFVEKNVTDTKSFNFSMESCDDDEKPIETKKYEKLFEFTTYDLQPMGCFLR